MSKGGLLAAKTRSGNYFKNELDQSRLPKTFYNLNIELSTIVRSTRYCYHRGGTNGSQMNRKY